MLINKPVSSFIATILIIFFLLLVTSLIKIYPCNKDFISNLYSNFLHEDFLHLLSNLYSLYVLSRIEQKIGSEKFVLIVSLIVVINTIIETSTHKIVNIPCSIGFSAILYGMLSWEAIAHRNIFDYQIIGAVSFDIILRVFSKTHKISLINHFMGLISGIIIGICVK